MDSFPAFHAVNFVMLYEQIQTMKINAFKLVNTISDKSINGTFHISLMRNPSEYTLNFKLLPGDNYK
jgi:hypothetical protein